MKKASIVFITILLYTILGCSVHEDKIFQVVNPDYSGIHFNNKLSETIDLNIFDYMYFYNGAGVAVGDLNGDDLVDVYFTSNQGNNKLFLNLGNLKFKDITITSNSSGAKGWATGVTLADVNGDGWLDIYICYVGVHLPIKARNQLLINNGVDKNGIPHFTEEAEKYGLAFSGFSTQATFFDYDNDGDLDMYLLNHSIHQNGTFGPALDLRLKHHPTAGDRLFRNTNGIFEDVSKEAGIYSSALGYGLGVVVGDSNMDGWLDIYVGNDFHENDYLYINQGNGTFVNELDSSIRHTSRYTMGVDMSDVNNDAYPDLISMDMLPENHKWSKSSAAEDPYDTYQFKKDFGYNEQYTRNALQLNNQNGTFSEVGIFAGVHATDWSWSALFADFDLDGNKDLFISNGIRRRSNDLDYINFISDEKVQKKLESGNNGLSYIKLMPEINVSNYIFKNNGDSTFRDMTDAWGISRPSYSNGAVYADLDNDGDLDIIVNNINDEAFIYRNLVRDFDQSEKRPASKFLQISLKGKNGNTKAVGAKVFLFANDRLQFQECIPTRGYQSSVDTRLNFGYTYNIDSIIVVWSDGGYNTLRKVEANQKISITEANNLPKFDYKRFKRDKSIFVIDSKLSLTYKHIENKFIDFDREALLPFMLSAEGPAVAVGDVNGDGREDIFLGGAKWQQSKLYQQTEEGLMIETSQQLLSSDSAFEDVDAKLIDVDMDGDLDLVCISGGNEFTGNSKYLQPRLYLNNGSGKFLKRGKLPVIYVTGSCVVPHDFDKDGDLDLFIGGRAVAGKYGIPANSYLLLNNGLGEFSDATSLLAQELVGFGFVNDAVWTDIDGDGDSDLIVASEWKPISIFYNNEGKLKMDEAKQPDVPSGWWNTIAAADFDNDGDIDLVAGNLGLNSRLKANSENPIRMYVNDFDGNGTLEQILTHIVNGVEYPIATRDEIVRQLPSLKKKILSYSEFSETSFCELFPEELRKESLTFEVNALSSAYVENTDDYKFKYKPLPKTLQFSSVNALLVDDFNKDGNLDVLAGGNFFHSNIQMGRYDASYGQMLMGDGSGGFKILSANESGISIQGQVKSLLAIKIGLEKKYMVVRNHDKVLFLKKRESPDKRLD